MAHISIVGAGYVGLVTAITFTKHKHTVTCIDISKEKVVSINSKKPPFYEENLEKALVAAIESKRLTATTSFDAIRKTDLTFICVETPSLKDGGQNLSIIGKATSDVGKSLREKKGYHLVVVKSSVTPTTTKEHLIPILERSSGKTVGKDVGICVNPEFLREGSALQDSFNPDRIVIGGFDKKSGNLLKNLYKKFSCPKIVVDLATAEMIKYASNSFLALKITYANEIANMCEKFGIDAEKVLDAVALDSRINPHFLKFGCGFGGSCFPKDLKALIHASEKYGCKSDIFRSVLKLNERQPLRLVEMLKNEIPNLKNSKVAVLGLSFKGNTNDVRESRAIPIISALIKEGAHVIAYDPVAMPNMKKIFKEIKYVDSIDDALDGADACIVQNDWEIFEELNSKNFNKMAKKIVIDGRRVLDRKKIGEDVKYYAIGLPNK
ncbi:MAG: UDP-glucose/GDP-mannose dehydrogenase family protein [Thermoplasmata archaeon]